ncbi:MAG: prolyl oligopeptidase family serine peptidase, partial [Oscillochloris sp.]|nr:prolyl oligopeptidase family serine peptidase [Oscillochloris sp.]
DRNSRRAATAIPPTATAIPPTATAIPPTATPDRYAEYAPLTIDGLRARSYGEGEIRVLQVLSETPQFTRELFEYESDGLRITGQLTRPRGAGPWPVVILNHGYFPLDVYRTGYDTQHASDYLAARGYLGLAPDFRSHAGSDIAPNIFKAGHVIDTLNLIGPALRLTEAQGDTVLMWGHSNGGEITLKAMLVSDRIAAGLIYAPASSFLADSYNTYSRGQTLWDPRNTADYPFTPDAAPDLYNRLSAYPHLEYLSAPVQWHHGTADPVPPEWSIVPHERLVALGKNTELFLYPGGTHSLQGADKELYLQRTLAFFDSIVGISR